MLSLLNVLPATYRGALDTARRMSDRVAEATSAPEEMPDTARYFITRDGKSGFGISREGELIGLFSLIPGRGNDLMGWAIGLGVERLDCFDGFLPTYYRNYGFAEYKREANWTPGGPDVVYMRLA
ncbi:hypothetical protein [Actinoplanes sp. NPDC026670]|uniref:hypothetical protein n=1 Tax=Actinoplanes sp. NPDC026670 TaxID=3154700 RepID=UPI0033C66AA4